ncbi:MAG: helix-turn-helix transcriptional regulator [Cyanobacteria bacterium P01_A01_bin.84]
MRKRLTNQQEKPSVLRELRDDAGLTQAQLAHHLKKDVSTIRRWEKGDEPSMTRSEWKKFCKLIGKNFNDLPEFLSSPFPGD